MATKRSVILIGIVLIAIPIVLMFLYNTVWRHVVVASVSRPFAQTGEQALDSGICAHWTVSGTLEGESRSFENGAKWTLGPSDLGDVDADVLSSRLELAFTEGCEGAPVEVEAVQARWGFAPGCSAVDAGLGEVPRTESASSCAFELSFGLDEQGKPESGAGSASASFVAASTGQIAEFDDRLSILDSGFVCFKAVASLTVYDVSGSESLPLEMEI